MKRRVPPPPPLEAEDPILTPDDIQFLVQRTMRYGDVYQLHSFISKLDPDSAYVSGSVTRSSSHYVHEKTTDFEIEVDWMGATKNGEELTPEEIEQGDILLNKAQEDIQTLVVQTNHAIYKSLGKEYEYLTSDEQVREFIQANDYDFDEEGKREVDGLFHFEQLNAAAQEMALDWGREVVVDHEWWDSTMDDWKEFLVDIGFGEEPEINFSGFWSQGDGASFTCKHFDLTKFVQFLSNPELVQRIE